MCLKALSLCNGVTDNADTAAAFLNECEERLLSVCVDINTALVVAEWWSPHTVVCTAADDVCLHNAYLLDRVALAPQHY